MLCVPSASVDEPLVVMLVVDDVATALPMATPSAKRVTVSPTMLEVTENCRALAGALLLKLVMSSELETPESVAAASVGLPGAAAGVSESVPTDALGGKVAGDVTHLARLQCHRVARTP